MTTTLLKIAALTLLLSTHALADGMVPETSVVIIHEAEGEAAVSVTNTDSQLALLHVTLEDIPEDTESLLVVTPPLSRVEASKSQLVRFILQNQQPLQTQRLKRVIFEGMPQGRPATEAGHARVGVTVRQNLPVIIHPKGLAPNRTPWTGLTWSLNGGTLQVRNDTPVCGATGPGTASSSWQRQGDVAPHLCTAGGKPECSGNRRRGQHSSAATGDGVWLCRESLRRPHQPLTKTSGALASASRSDGSMTVTRTHRRPSLECLS